MKFMRYSRFAMLAMLLFVSGLTAHAGVFISVTVAPPVLPVYEQPPCPEPDLIWMPGYWAYDYDAQSYYWVPGAWVPAPFEGALWTPPYWGWEEGVYAFHPGYWGHEVGYYGGVNYGWGYFGVGFVGGRWHERHFEYNEAVWHVNRTVIHETYVDRTVIREHEIDERHVAYAGGPGGVRHEPTFEERRAMQVQHVPPTQYQQQHMQQARSERQNFVNVNHGRPQMLAVDRPLPAQHITPPPAMRGGAEVNGSGGMRDHNMPANGGMRGVQQQPQQRGPDAPHGGEAPQRGLMSNGPSQNNQVPQSHNMPAQPPTVGVPAQRGGRAEQPVYATPGARQQQPENRQLNEGQRNRPEPVYRPQEQQPQSRHMPEDQPQYRATPNPQPQYQHAPQVEPQYRQAPPQQPQSRPMPMPQSRPEPQYRPAPMPQSRPEPQNRPAPQPQAHPAPEARPAPAPRAEHESRPEHDHR